MLLRGHNHSNVSNFNNITDATFPMNYRRLWFGFVIYLFAIAASFSLEYWILLSAISIFPFLLLTLFDLKLSLYTFIVGIFIGWIIIEEPFALRPIDVLTVLMIIAYFFNKLLHADFTLTTGKVQKSILIFIVAISLSLIDTADIKKSLLNLFKHLELFALYFIITDFTNNWKLEQIKRLLEYFLYIAFAATTVAIVQLIVSDESRAFGITGVPLADLTVGALLVSISFFVFSTSKYATLKYALISLLLLTGLVLTQTRGAWISFFLSLSFMWLIVRKKSIVHSRKRILGILFLLLLSIMITFLIFPNIFTGITHRVEEVKYFEIGTIQLRLMLWEAAFRAFLSHPINGIGLGQFTVLSDNFSSLGMSSIFKENVGGLNAHNITFSYLAETGIIGIIGLILFYSSFMILASKTFNRAKTLQEIELSTALYTNLFFVVVSSVYAGEWFWGLNGAQFILFLALMSTISKKVYNYQL